MSIWHALNMAQEYAENLSILLRGYREDGRIPPPQVLTRLDSLWHQAMADLRGQIRQRRELPGQATLFDGEARHGLGG